MDVVVLAQHWAPGCVNAHLCPPLTPDQAAMVHLCCLDVTVARLLASIGATVTVAYTPEDSRPAFAQRYRQVTLLPGGQGDLSAQLHAILAWSGGPCLIIRGDSPTVPLAYFHQAERALAGKADVVLGAGEDGDVFLLGARPTTAAWFDDIPWETNRVAVALRAGATAQGWRLVETETWYGVRAIEDIGRMYGDLVHGGDSLLAAPWLPYLRKVAGADGRR